MRVFFIDSESDPSWPSTSNATIDLWRSQQLEVHRLALSESHLNYQKESETKGLPTSHVQSTDLVKIEGLPGSPVVLFDDQASPDQLASLRLLGCRIIWYQNTSILSENDRRNFMLLGLPDAFVFQSDYQRREIESQLAAWNFNLQTSYLIGPALAHPDIEFRPLAHNFGEPFVVGRAAPPAVDQWSSNTWPIYARIQYRHVRALMLGMDDLTHKKLGPTPSWAHCHPTSAMTLPEYLGQLHCLLPIYGGAKAHWPQIGLAAMAAGVPIVAQHAWGWPEMIEHGVTGFLGRCDQELAHYAALLAYDEELRMRVIQAAYSRYVNQLCCQDKLAKEWATLFGSLPAVRPMTELKSERTRIPAVHVSSGIGQVWGITTYFNPIGYQTKLENYRAFRQQFPLPLATVEVSDGSNFTLTSPDAELLWQWTGESCIWQKEAAINAAVRLLPVECDAVAWVDADLLWERFDWAAELPAALAESVLLQPFQSVVRLPRGAQPHDLNHTALPWGTREGYRALSFCRAAAKYGHDRLVRGESLGSPGYAWVARRELLEEVGLYPYNVFGGGDMLAAHSCVTPAPVQCLTSNSKFVNSIERWRSKWYAQVRGKIGYLPGYLFHLWHGDYQDRGYNKRHKILDEQGYNPDRDVTHDAHGLLAWTNSRFREVTREQFKARQEDGDPRSANSATRPSRFVSPVSPPPDEKPAVSLVTSCMNRHAHLQEVLPTWLNKGFAEIVVLDWSSTPPLAKTIEAFQDGTIVTVELIKPQQHFNQAKSKNLKMRLARHPLICSLDCDVKILAPDFIARHPMKSNRFYAHGNQHLGGSGFFWRADWEQFGGCNEGMIGWGYEDWDLYERMKKSNWEWRKLVAETVYHIPHDDQQRTQNFAQEHRLINNTRAHNYLLARQGSSWTQEQFHVRIIRPGAEPVEQWV